MSQFKFKKFLVMAIIQMLIHLLISSYQFYYFMARSKTFLSHLITGEL